MRFSVGYLRQSIEWSMNVSSPVSSPVTPVKKSSLSQTFQLRITLGYVTFRSGIPDEGLRRSQIFAPLARLHDWQSSCRLSTTVAPPLATGMM